MVDSIERYDDVDVFIGLDVGKGEHHAVALDRSGKRLFDRALPNDETRLHAILTQMQEHGLVLLVVDQPCHNRRATGRCRASRGHGQKAKGDYVEPLEGRKTQAMFEKTWEHERLAPLKRSSRHAMETAWRVHVEPQWGGRSVAGIKQSEIAEWVAELNTKRKAQTVRRITFVLSGILAIATRERAIPRNPAAGIALPAKRRKSPLYLTHAQVVTLSGVDAEHELMFEFLAYTDLRWGEAVALRIRHLNMLRKRITIEDNAVMVKGTYEIGTPAQTRVVPMPPHLVESIAKACEQKGPDSFLFSDDPDPLPHTPRAGGSHTRRESSTAHRQDDPEDHPTRPPPHCGIPRRLVGSERESRATHAPPRLRRHDPRRLRGPLRRGPRCRREGHERCAAVSQRGATYYICLQDMHPDCRVHIMLDDVTQRIVIREAALLSEQLYECFDTAARKTRKKLPFSETNEPHAHAFYRRAEFRARLSKEPLPGGWQVGGNSRLGGQLILHHSDLSMSFRVLSESRVTKNGVPHAGHTRARQAEWAEVPIFGIDGFTAHRRFLLLTNSRSTPSKMRLVHPIDPGKYKGTVACDFNKPVLRDSAAMAASFTGADEYQDFFTVKIDAVESDER